MQCPLCERSKGPAVVAQNEWAVAIPDGFPLSHGHTLVIPKRHEANVFDLTGPEQRALLELVGIVRARLAKDLNPYGFNIGINIGRAAGQTVDHAHIHVIPRVQGDVADPRGGVRWVIPAKANYWDPPSSPTLSGHELLPGGNDRMLRAVRARLADKSFDRVDLVVSFVMSSGLDLVGEALREALARDAHVRVLTTDYLRITDGAALLRFLDWAEDHPDRLSVRVFHDDSTSFHPKGYIFWSSNSGATQAIVGSSNLSASGLRGGIEWNVVTEQARAMRAAFDAIWNDRRSQTLTRDWAREYSRTKPMYGGGHDQVTPPEVPQKVDPRPIQNEALERLTQARREGYKAGLVVMATGLGKTYLAAFDSLRFQRVLFVAHRDEILKQSRDSFRRVRPDADLGLYHGDEKTPDASIVFASVQTLARHLDAFAANAFDYIVVDEFHHASAGSYRRVLDHFAPAFLLGLTATPDRMDGADLLALCGNKLIYDCNLVEGIRRKELCPFEYFGVKDVVDFQPIPWKNGKFDEQALTRAVETQERADQSLREWRNRGGRRTLAFCCTITHADYMARHFAAAGVRCVSVHSGASTAPRAAAVEALERGEIDVLFSVEVFNEGLDVPAIDTVLMLRPTESPVVFLQQVGRGLRRAGDSKVLKVIDFIGNHRSFLLKPRTLLSLGSSVGTGPCGILEAMKQDDFNLPEGCKVHYELDVVDMFKELLRLSSDNQAELWCREVFEETGLRPSAAQAARAGFNPGSLRKKHGGWFDFLKTSNMLSPAEAIALSGEGGEFLKALETEPITKSYKLVTLRALIHEGALLEGLDQAKLSQVSYDLMRRDPRLLRDVETKEIPDPAKVDSDTWAKYWRGMPLAAWAGQLKGHPGRWFELRGESFIPRFKVKKEGVEPFQALTAELVEWRLQQYLLRKEPLGEGVIRCKVIHNTGSPIIMFPPAQRERLPQQANVEFIADGAMYRGDFTKIAMNVARVPAEKGNALPALLRDWFGPSAGLPGTNHHVLFGEAEGHWVLQADRPERAEGGGTSVVLPFYSDYRVACGAFEGILKGERPASTQELPNEALDGSKTADLFVVVARGDSMEGGTNPVRHGDRLLMRWVRAQSRADLHGKVVLVDRGRDQGTDAALKRLARVGTSYELRSDNSTSESIKADETTRIVGVFVKRLDQLSYNPIASHLHQEFKREDIPALYGVRYSPGNWNSGHVSLPGRAILLTTLSKDAMREGGEYSDHLEGFDRLVWSSQTSTALESKKGKELLGCLDTGTEIHVWLRRKKSDVSFVYCGLAAPLRHEGERPIHITWRLLTSLSHDIQRRLS
jgi:superfamily II DNA or RNA helicase/diadenosine tetraphosphate (Ap4A) HIT family hydrolase